jgi:hypothetical protein
MRSTYGSGNAIQRLQEQMNLYFNHKSERLASWKGMLCERQNMRRNDEMQPVGINILSFLFCKISSTH